MYLGRVAVSHHSLTHYLVLLVSALGPSFQIAARVGSDPMIVARI